MTASARVKFLACDHMMQVLSGKYILRFAVGAPLTEERHVTAAWKVLQEEASALLGSL
jgi:aromatic-L-amino-acid decarboxylase